MVCHRRCCSWAPLGSRLIWFALFFMLFMSSAAGFIVDALTQPMKNGRLLGCREYSVCGWLFPLLVAASFSSIGRYQLLVADARVRVCIPCSRSKAPGSALPKCCALCTAFRNIALAIPIVSISFASANVVRVMIVADYYHFGDEAGAGFLLHGFSGMVLFLSALLLIIGADMHCALALRVKRPARA